MKPVQNYKESSISLQIHVKFSIFPPLFGTKMTVSNPQKKKILATQAHYWQSVLAKTYIINYISLTFYN
jgi:hypothetical protein